MRAYTLSLHLRQFGVTSDDASKQFIQQAAFQQPCPCSKIAKTTGGRGRGVGQLAQPEFWRLWLPVQVAALLRFVNHRITDAIAAAAQAKVE